MQIAKGLRAAAAAFKSTIEAEKSAQRYEAAKKKIVCVHCGGDAFFKGGVSAGGYGVVAGAPFDVSGLEVLICSQCRRAEVFAADLSHYEESNQTTPRNNA